MLTESPKNGSANIPSLCFYSTTKIFYSIPMITRKGSVSLKDDNISNSPPNSPLCDTAR